MERPRSCAPYAIGRGMPGAQPPIGSILVANAPFFELILQFLNSTLVFRVFYYLFTAYTLPT